MSSKTGAEGLQPTHRTGTHKIIERMRQCSLSPSVSFRQLLAQSFDGSMDLPQHLDHTASL